MGFRQDHLNGIRIILIGRLGIETEQGRNVIGRRVQDRKGLPGDRLEIAGARKPGHGQRARRVIGTDGMQRDAHHRIARQRGQGQRIGHGGQAERCRGGDRENTQPRRAPTAVESITGCRKH